MSTKNKYDAAIEYLLAQPDFDQAVFRAWVDPNNYPEGCLFSFVTPDKEQRVIKLQTGRYERCGCLTQIHSREGEACTPELTMAIRADSRLPDCVEDIRPEHLPIFKEWQERIDRELGRS